jgi:hypothetical protein
MTPASPTPPRSPHNIEPDPAMAVSNTIIADATFADYIEAKPRKARSESLQ